MKYPVAPLSMILDSDMFEPEEEKIKRSDNKTEEMIIEYFNRCKARYEAAEAYIEALHEYPKYPEVPSETNRINVDVRKSEWLSYVELKAKEK